jgi:glycine dehydrogenase subunit 1
VINSRLLGHKIVGGFPLKKFYPELGNAALWCCTELTTRSAIDTVCGLLSEYEETSKTNEPHMQEVAQ